MATAPPAAQSLSVGSLLQRSIEIFQRHAAVLLWCVVLVVAPLLVVGGLVGVAAGSGGTRTYELGTTLMTVVGALGGLIGVAACMRVALRDRAGEPVTLSDALGFGLRHYPMVLAVTLIVGLGVFAGFLACVLPGIYVLVRWSLAIPTMLAEGGGIGDALRRGWELVEHRWWVTFGMLLAGYLLPAIVALVLQRIVLVLFGVALQDQSPDALLGYGVAQLLGSCITMPFSAIFLILLRSDLVATAPVTTQQRADWPPPVAPVGPYGPPPVGGAAPAAPAPAPPWPAPVPPPLPDGFLAPEPAEPPSGSGIAPPPQRPPGAGSGG